MEERASHGAVRKQRNQLLGNANGQVRARAVGVRQLASRGHNGRRGGGRALAGIRQHTSAYVSIPQHTTAYVSIRQYATLAVPRDSASDAP